MSVALVSEGRRDDRVVTMTGQIPTAAVELGTQLPVIGEAQRTTGVEHRIRCSRVIQRPSQLTDHRGAYPVGGNRAEDRGGRWTADGERVLTAHDAVQDQVRITGMVCPRDHDGLGRCGADVNLERTGTEAGRGRLGDDAHLQPRTGTPRRDFYHRFAHGLLVGLGARIGDNRQHVHIAAGGMEPPEHSRAMQVDADQVGADSGEGGRDLSNVANDIAGHKRIGSHEAEPIGDSPNSAGIARSSRPPDRHPPLRETARTWPMRAPETGRVLGGT